MRERDAFSEALESLRHRLRSGRFSGGGQLVVVELAQELGFSPTPLREALARLAGEGLIEDRRGAGFFGRILGVLEIRDLYQANAALAQAAIACERAPAPIRRFPTSRAAEDDPLAACEALFAGLIARAGNRVLAEMLRGLQDRLAPLRQVEPLVLEDLRGELADIGAAQEPHELLAQISRYHQRRLAALEPLALAVRARAEDLTEE